MPEDSVYLEKKGLIATIVLNRPEKKNSFNHEMLEKLAGFMSELARGDETRVVIIRGAGNDSFSTGYDISELRDKLPGHDNVMAQVKSALDIGLSAIENFPYPVIAMINGYALGGGCELAMTCDIRVASMKSRMGIPSSKLGIVYQPSGIQKIVNIIGMANARELFYSGKYYEMDKIMDMGLVNYAIDGDKLDSFTYDLAVGIAENAPLSLKGLKKIFTAMNSSTRISCEYMKEIESMIAASFNSDDFKEASTAFLEKRKPLFKGR